MSRSSTARRRAQSGATNRSQPARKTSAIRAARPEPTSHDRSREPQDAAAASTIDERTTSSENAATSTSSSPNRVCIPPDAGGVTTSGNHFVDATSETSPNTNGSSRSHPTNPGSTPDRCKAISEPNVSANGDTANRHRDNAAGPKRSRVIPYAFRRSNGEPPPYPGKLRKMRQYHHRPATHDDIPAIQTLVAACETALHGHAETDPDAIAADFARTGLQMTTDTRLIHHDGTLAARAWVNRRSEIDVHPAHRGRGLGTALLRWAETRARETGATEITQTIPDNDTAAGKLLRAHRYHGKVNSWLLQTTRSNHPPPPERITLRAYQPQDAPALHQLLEDAFDEWQQRRKTYEEWARHTIERATFAPAMSPIALHGKQIAGAVIAFDDPASPDGYIDRLAVHRDHRGQGIARHLLNYAFETFRHHGKPTTTLWTHSDTGALTLYQHLDMTVRRSSTVHHKDLTKDLT